MAAVHAASRLSGVVAAGTILMPIIAGAGFDPIWFGAILTVNLELGLITPSRWSCAHGFTPCAPFGACRLDPDNVFMTRQPAPP